MLYITSSESEDILLGPSMREPSPVMVKIAKAERGEMSEKEMKELIEFLKTREEVMRLGSGLGGESGSTEEPAKRIGATADESKQNKELVELLIKETRELMEMLNAAKSAKKHAEAKPRNAVSVLCYLGRTCRRAGTHSRNSDLAAAQFSTSCSSRLTSTGSIAPASHTSASATVQATARRNKAWARRTFSQPSTRPASNELPDPIGLTTSNLGGIARGKNALRCRMKTGLGPSVTMPQTTPRRFQDASKSATSTSVMLGLRKWIAASRRLSCRVVGQKPQMTLSAGPYVSRKTAIFRACVKAIRSLYRP